MLFLTFEELFTMHSQVMLVTAKNTQQEAILPLRQRQRYGAI